MDALGNPTGFHLTEGQACELDGADVLLPQIRACTVIADKGFDADQRVLDPLQHLERSRSNLISVSAEMYVLMLEAEDFMRAAKATLRAYRSDWSHFEIWCQAHQIPGLPAEPQPLRVILGISPLAEPPEPSRADLLGSPRLTNLRVLTR